MPDDPRQPEVFRVAAWRLDDCRSLTIHPTGLIEELRRWRIRVTPWEDVRGVERHDHYALILLADRTLRIDGRYGDWHRLADAVEARRAELRSARQGLPVTAEQLAEWLRIPVDGVLVCRRWIGRDLAAALLALAGLYLVAGVSRGTIGAGTAGCVLVWLLIVLAAVRASADQIRADTSGLTLRLHGRPQRYAWSDIEWASRTERTLTVSTTGGLFSVTRNTSNFQILCQALDRVTAYRLDGAILPTDAPLPDGALSRLGGAEEDPAARGISLADDAAGSAPS